MRSSVDWHIGHNKILHIDRTYVMGILNVTPDSFSDGGLFAAADSAINHAYEMIEQGADIIDIGGQSTRPGHTPISPEEEWGRIQPVLNEICGKINVPISVDTYYPEVAKKAAECGVEIFNDVTGFRDPLMRKYAADLKVGCIVMHDIQLSEEADACAALLDFYKKRTEECIADGIAPEYICLDPGIGFGKSYEQNLQIAAQFERQCLDGYTMLAAASRKRVVGMSCGNPPFDKRCSGTIAIHTACILKGAHIIRVHDVPESVQAARVTDAIMTQI